MRRRRPVRIRIVALAFAAILRCRHACFSARRWSRNAIYSEVAGADTLAFAPRSEPVAQRSTNLSVWRSVLAHGKDGPNGQDASDAHHEPA